MTCTCEMPTWDDPHVGMCDYCEDLAKPATNEKELVAKALARLYHPADNDVHWRYFMREAQAAVAALTPAPDKALMPDAAVGDGYQAAFYHLAKLLDIPAKPQSPQCVWINDMLPRLQEMIAATNAGQVEEVEHLQQIADGAMGDGPFTRGAAKRELERIAALHPKPASTDTDEGNGK